MLFKILWMLVFVNFSLHLNAATRLQEMSLEEKVGQLLMVHFNGKEANTDAKVLINDVHVGGFIYYTWANGLDSPEQVHKLSASLQKMARDTRLGIPLLIAIDQEGGRVTRLTKGFTLFPDNMTVGKTGDSALAEQNAYVMGKELRAVGINMNLAPVVDVNSNPNNPIIGARAFGETPSIVIPFAKAALKGYHRAGIITTIKHFPGYGDVDVDPHEALPVIKKTKKQLETMELVPFVALAPYSDAVMTAHLMVPALDSRICATISKNILNILRREIGFNGVIITDSLIMDGLQQITQSVDEAAILALDAGSDILLLGGKLLSGQHASKELTVADVKRIHQNLVNAVKNGRIPEARVDAAVQRILDLKGRFLLSVTSAELHTIGELIWKNECNSSIAGLTHWNKGEDFGSFGIGHFIWYPESKKDRFQESFPDLLKFLASQGIRLPLWLAQAKGAPWSSRDEFYKDIQSPKMVELRQLLFDTRSHQALFIAMRLEKALPEIMNPLPSQEQETVSTVFHRLAQDPRGLYALIDYSNFKGTGASTTEAYQGQGWGLLQVLKKIPPGSKNILAEFVSAAKTILTERVQNAPPERHEERWLKGWLNRIDTYIAKEPFPM